MGDGLSAISFLLDAFLAVFPTSDYRPRTKTPFATSAHRAAAMTPMKRRTSSSVSQTSRPRRSSDGACRSGGWLSGRAAVRPDSTFGAVRLGRGESRNRRLLGWRAPAAASAPSRASWTRSVAPALQRWTPRAEARAVSVPPRREIAQPLREVVVGEKGAGIGAGTERSQSATCAGATSGSTGAQRDSARWDRRLPQPGGHGRAQAAIGQGRQRRQLRGGVPLIDLGQRSAAEHAERAAGVVPGATALALGHGPPSGSVQARRLSPCAEYSRRSWR